MRAILVLTTVAVTACDQLGMGRSSSDASLVSSSGGQVALADGGTLDFGITSEQYKRWERARRGIDRRIAARFGAILQPDAPTERSIEAAVAYLDSEPAARRSIEAAGMSTRAFVVMTVALEQEMRRASGQPVVRQPAPAPYEFPTVDTTMIMPPTPVPVPVQPYPVDTVGVTPVVPPVPVDTTIASPRVLPRPTRDSTRPLPPTIFRRDTTRPRLDSIRRDTARRDSVRRDTGGGPRPVTPPPPPPPAPDTAAASPPDTLRVP